eukprot:4418321-Amphidinium_carterae.1
MRADAYPMPAATLPTSELRKGAHAIVHPCRALSVDSPSRHSCIRFCLGHAATGVGHTLSTSEGDEASLLT